MSVLIYLQSSGIKYIYVKISFNRIMFNTISWTHPYYCKPHQKCAVFVALAGTCVGITSLIIF